MHKCLCLLGFHSVLIVITVILLMRENVLLFQGQEIYEYLARLSFVDVRKKCVVEQTQFLTEKTRSQVTSGVTPVQ